MLQSNSFASRFFSAILLAGNNLPVEKEDTGDSSRRKRQASSTSSSDTDEDSQSLTPEAKALQVDPLISGEIFNQSSIISCISNVNSRILYQSADAQ